ncbi:type 1 glutamine amidotransferase family protein [Paenibacillus piscarius]|uniref:type 1 glutamine amidotransferase family protein n=1 Tax=Paenibacillus piscarius TaxID=1089681 RepID=UPI001EE83F9F|nr:type 1 glutamine amidotransferase family protein [Paenibacillus piscarius]
MSTRQAYLYVFNTMSDWEYGYLVAELNTGRYFRKNIAPIKVTTVSAAKETVTTMGGLAIQPDITLEECRLESGDLLILPGGTTWREPENQAVLERIDEALKLGVTVGAICGAVEALADRGILDAVPHTSNNLDYLKMVCPNYKGEASHVQEPAAAGGHLVTASGTAPLEFAREVLKALEVCTSDTLEAWYGLNKTQEAGYFFQLMSSVDRG